MTLWTAAGGQLAGCFFRQAAEERKTMRRKIVLLGLAVMSAAVVALPTNASAAELHLTDVTSFWTTTFGLATLTSEGEPTITCSAGLEVGNHVTGTVSAGGTTGTLSFSFTGCHASVFGLTSKCHTEGSTFDNTIKSSGVFHLITTNEKRAILLTPVSTSIICAGISNTTVAGNLIGTITSPVCGGSSSGMSIKFNASGAAQEHTFYTGTTYRPTAQTGTGAVKQAGWSFGFTLSSTSTGILDCT
jgi:hypothetical protein